jgi:uncharacterized protein YqeY
MTIIELKKMMMKAKKEDKTRANALMMLVDTAQKIAKEKNEEVNEKHIIAAAKKLTKMAKESIDAGMKEAKKELSIYEQFLPKTLNEKQTEELINNLIKEKNLKNIGEVMREIKDREDIDKRIASQIAKRLLS